MEDKKTIGGSCHCEGVKFQAEIPKKPTIYSCNCSMCNKTAYLHLIVPNTDFKLLGNSKENIETYTFNTGVAKHHFCKKCGIKSFYVPRSHPDGISINARCVDDLDLDQIDIIPFDGQNWEENIQKIT